MIVINNKLNKNYFIIYKFVKLKFTKLETNTYKLNSRIDFLCLLIKIILFPSLIFLRESIFITFNNDLRYHRIILSNYF